MNLRSICQIFEKVFEKKWTSGLWCFNIVCLVTWHTDITRENPQDDALPVIAWLFSDLLLYI